MLLFELKSAKLDEFISMARGNDCGEYYSLYYGFENPIIKCIDYMKKAGRSDDINLLNKYERKLKKSEVITFAFLNKLWFNVYNNKH